jgi:hypothetical protein
MGIILILLIILPILLRLDAYVADPYNCDFTMRTLTHVGVEGLLTIALEKYYDVEGLHVCESGDAVGDILYKMITP